MSQDFINNAVVAKIGDVTQVGTSPNEWGNFNKLPSTVVAGLTGITIENDKVWEGGNGLKDRRILVKKNGFTYMLGTYYQTVEDLNNFQGFISSFHFSSQ